MDHNDLTEQQREILVEIYAACGQTADALPYTEAFDQLHAEFERRTGVTLSQHHFWRAVSNARKASHLPRKERFG